MTSQLQSIHSVTWKMTIESYCCFYDSICLCLQARGMHAVIRIKESRERKSWIRSSHVLLDRHTNWQHDTGRQAVLGQSQRINSNLTLPNVKRPTGAKPSKTQNPKSSWKYTKQDPPLHLNLVCTQATEREQERATRCGLKQTFVGSVFIQLDDY